MEEGVAVEVVVWARVVEEMVKMVRRHRALKKDTWSVDIVGRDEVTSTRD